MKTGSLFVLAIFSIFLLAETTVRVIAPQPGPKDFSQIAGWSSNEFKSLHTPNTDLNSWVLRDNVAVQHRDKTDSTLNFEVTTKSMHGIGYRSTETERALELCKDQVWNFGDGMTFGFGLSQSQTYSSLLNSKNKCSLNLGVPAFTLSQELALFRLQFEHARQKPRAVTFAISWNDDILEETRRADLFSRRTSLEPVSSEFQQLHFYQLSKSLELKLLNFSHFYRLLTEKIYLARQPSDATYEYGIYTDLGAIDSNDPNQTNLYRQSWVSIEHFLKLAESFDFKSYPDIKFTFILIPSKKMISEARAQPKDRETINQISKVFTGRLAQVNVETVDLFDTFINSKEDLFFNRDFHLNSAGHRLIAKKLAEQTQP